MIRGTLRMRQSTAAANVYPTLDALLAAVRGCRVCEAHLPLGPRPVLRAGEAARILVVGQAPGLRVQPVVRSRARAPGRSRGRASPA